MFIILIRALIQCTEQHKHVEYVKHLVFWNGLVFMYALYRPSCSFHAPSDMPTKESDGCADAHTLHMLHPTHVLRLGLYTILNH